MSTLDPSEGLALFTDGSAYYKDRIGGWAWIALDAFEGIDKGSGKHGNTTNNQMELMGPTEGLLHLARQFGQCEVLVYSDSEYVVKGAMDRTRARRTNRKFWKRLDEAMAKHTYVEFIHVKGHSGHIYNEMADQLAGQARKKGTQKWTR